MCYCVLYRLCRHSTSKVLFKLRCCEVRRGTGTGICTLCRHRHRHKHRQQVMIVRVKAVNQVAQILKRPGYFTTSYSCYLSTIIITTTRYYVCTLYKYNYLLLLHNIKAWIMACKKIKKRFSFSVMSVFKSCINEQFYVIMR